jgi:hypothetical protein
MPNKIKPYKRGVAITGHVHVGISRKGASVKALLERLPIRAIARISDQSAAQKKWREWLSERLPEGLFSRISGVVEQDAMLTVFTESAAWSARARYALAELENDIKKESAGIRNVVVRVMPRQRPKRTDGSKP